MPETVKTKSRTLEVLACEDGEKLSQYLRRKMGQELPGSLIMRIIRSGEVRVNGGRAKPFDRLKTGQRVRIPPFAPAAKSQPAPAAAQDLEIIFEDAELLVINKPAGLPTQPGSGWKDAITARLAALYAQCDFIPIPVHRLDRDTSGVLIAAKTHPKLRELTEAFRNRQPQKEYLAWVAGEFKLEPGQEWLKMEDEIEKKGLPGAQKMRTGEGKLALSYAKPLLFRDNQTLVLLKLETGLTHQLRVQLASRGNPIIGDPKYGRGKPPMLLHAFRITYAGSCFQVAPGWLSESESTVFI